MSKSAPDAPEDDSQDSSRPQIVVDDPEDFAATRQLRAIFDARDDYVQARRDANDAHDDSGGMSFPQMNAYIFRYMQDFAMAAEPLLLSYDDGRELWEEQQYGIESSFVEHSALASLDDGLELFQQLADEVIDGHLTPRKLQLLTNSFGIELSRAEMRKVIDAVQEQSHQQQSTPNVTLEAETIDDISDMDMNRLQAAVEQSQRRQRQKPSVDTGQLFSAIQRVQNRSSSWMTTAKNDKLEHKLRLRATDWGWKTTGIKSLVRETPKLAYSKASGPTFGTTAPPQVVSNDVFRDIQLFLDDIGLGITFDEEQQTKINDRLLDEVEDWRSRTDETN